MGGLYGRTHSNQRAAAVDESLLLILNNRSAFNKRKPHLSKSVNNMAHRFTKAASAHHGQFTLTLTPHPSPTDGSAGTVTARLTSGSHRGLGGVRLSLKATGAKLSRSAVTTSADGSATFAYNSASNTAQFSASGRLPGETMNLGKRDQGQQRLIGPRPQVITASVIVRCPPTVSVNAGCGCTKGSGPTAHLGPNTTPDVEAIYVNGVARAWAAPGQTATFTAPVGGIYKFQGAIHEKWGWRVTVVSTSSGVS